MRLSNTAREKDGKMSIIKQFKDMNIDGKLRVIFISLACFIGASASNTLVSLIVRAIYALILAVTYVYSINGVFNDKNNYKGGKYNGRRRNNRRRMRR